MEKHDVVKAWLNNVAYSHSKSRHTENLYNRAIRLFCSYIDLTPQQILEEYEKMTDRQFRRKYAQYLRGYISQYYESGLALNTVNVRVSAIRSFFKYNDLPLGYVPLAKPRVTFHNRDITKEEIIKILEVSRPRDRAFFCIMAQSGLRPATLCNLRLKHIEPEFSKGIPPCKIDVPQDLAKGKYREYFTFMGDESSKYLQTFLDTRPNINSESYLFTVHGLEKKADPKSFSQIFARTIEKLKAKGLIEFEQKQKGKPRTVRLYNLRKFFRKYANQAGFEFVQFWMGHIVKAGVDEHYRPKDVEFHRQLYKEKAMPYLRLETKTPGETEQTIKELRSKLEQRNHEYQKIAERLKSLEDFVNSPEFIKEAISQIRQLLGEKKFQRALKEEE